MEQPLLGLKLQQSTVALYDTFYDTQKLHFAESGCVEKVEQCFYLYDVFVICFFFNFEVVN